MLKPVIAVGALGLLPLLAHAAGNDPPEMREAAAAHSGDTYLGVDVTPEYLHQDFARAEADLFTLRVAPYVQFGAWELGVDLPWQHIEGEYFINGGRAPSASYFCRWIDNGGPLVQALLARRGISASQIDYCQDNAGQFADNPSSEVSGWSDATLALKYGAPLNADGSHYGSVGLSYKWDNADSETGLGSGTRDTRLAGAVKLRAEAVTLLAGAGYTWIASDEDIAYLDSFDATLDLSMPLAPAVSLGGTWSFQQTSVEYLDDDVRSLTAHLDLAASDRAVFSLFLTDYLDVDGYPDIEYGGSATIALGN